MVEKMKKLIFVLLLILFALSVNAQGVSSLNQDQLNLALKKSQNLLGTGATVTVVGTVTGIVGLVMYFNGLTGISSSNNYSGIDDNFNKSMKGVIVGLVGGGVACIGLPLWIMGAINKNEIEIALVKFNPKGSTSINGIGLKIRF